MLWYLSNRADNLSKWPAVAAGSPIDATVGHRHASHRALHQETPLSLTEAVPGCGDVLCDKLLGAVASHRLARTALARSRAVAVQCCCVDRGTQQRSALNSTREKNRSRSSANRESDKCRSLL